MTRAAAAPRLYALVAARAPVAAVFRRGPAAWWQVGRWDLTSGDYEPGAWLHGTLYPRRCDLSPDGSLLLAFVMKRTAPGFLEAEPPAFPDTYVTVSKLPWLHSLAAWREGSTWGRGYGFVEGTPSRRPFALGEADAGDAAPLRRRYGVEPLPVLQYALERRRGWGEATGSPPRADGGPWDEGRSAVLVKERPSGPGRLVLRDAGTQRARAIELRAPTFELERRRGRVALEEAAWADWDPQGRLLVATRTGRLEVRDADDRALAIVRAHDLAPLRPLPRPAPAWATRW